MHSHGGWKHICSWWWVAAWHEWYCKHVVVLGAGFRHRAEKGLFVRVSAARLSQSVQILTAKGSDQAIVECGCVRAGSGGSRVGQDRRGGWSRCEQSCGRRASSMPPLQPRAESGRTETPLSDVTAYTHCRTQATVYTQATHGTNSRLWISWIGQRNMDVIVNRYFR